MRSRIRAAIAALVAISALALGAVTGPAPASAQGNPYQRGPAPTSAALEAARGPFAIQQTTVGRQTGFNGGTIYYPTDTSQGDFGAIAVSPGFLSPQAAIAWSGPRVASHGFVVITINTNGLFDFPNARADQLQAALDWLVASSPVRDRIDGSRLGVAGHSMGGGGTLEAARDNPDMQAAVAWQPWDLANFSTMRTPSMIIGAQNDAIASVASHSEPFYTQIPASAEKAYLELAGQGHGAGTQANTTQAKYTVAWFKRYIDNDTRYEQFLCPRPSGPTIAEYRDTCPGS